MAGVGVVRVGVAVVEVFGVGVVQVGVAAKQWQRRGRREGVAK